MMKSELCTLTTNELASALALCGYESMASQILNSLNLEENNVAIDRFIEDTDLSLTVKGLKDDSRDTMVGAELEELIHILVQSKKKVRCIRRDKVLFIHLIEGEEKVVFQEISKGKHVFSVQLKDNGFQSVLLKHFELSGKLECQETPALQLSEEIYNLLHQMDLNTLDSMIFDEKLEKHLRQFLSDFKSNSQEFDNLSFIEMDYINDYFEMKQVIFLLPSANLVWHLDYDNIHEKEVFVVPYNGKFYSEKLSEEISQFI
ncbi:hypothetical protein [Terribacillus halophilus]|jgi:hypothetical protein|uniref:hypothetical protein n=1 Tax=Terribacillus halophilus TaxID=361279 RepID=UPI0009863B12|nr:hypothetical protein [Terribacillus halophilus]